MAKKPNKKVIRLQIEQTAGAARLATSLKAPEGYVFHSMHRNHKGEVKITYVLLEDSND